jgi:predicted acyl esterase
MMKKYFLIFFLFISLFAQSQITYTSVMIPMRDGKFLAADYYLPAACSSCPVILIQTPYQKNWYHFGLPLGVGTNLPNSNYAFVIVDWRGFYGSAAALVASPNRGEDGYDVIEWISQQTWCDGNIGTWGPSALGKIQFETAREQHPYHKCAVPLVADPVFRYEDYYPGGVYRTEYVEQLDALGYGLSTFILANQVKNATWNFAQNSSTYPASINIPMFMIGGWFDHNVDGMLEFFDLLKTQSPVAVRDKHKLLMGPWSHGGSGAASVGSATQGDWSFPNAAGMSDSLALKFFDYYLRGMTNNEWTAFDNYDSYEYETSQMEMGNFDLRDWTLFNPQTFYLTNNGILGSIPTNTFDTTIVYDPRDPSPTVGGPTLKPILDQGPYNQEPVVESRNDIATFTNNYLFSSETYSTIYGKPQVHLFVSSDRKDTDFAVRLTDVDLNTGESILLADGIRRLRFRDGFTGADTNVAVPGIIYELIIDLPCISHIVQYDHGIRLDVTSSNYPRFDANLNNGGTMYAAGDTLIATNTIYMNPNNASYITLPIHVWGSVNEKSNSFLINTYPNPAKNEINISLPYEENWTISITDISGKIISTQNYFGNKFSSDVNNFSKGIYFIRLTNSQNQLYHSRFIKN